MWKTILTYLQNLLTLGRDVDRLQADVKRLEEKNHQLTLALQRLAHEHMLLAQREQNARENYQLRLRLELMELEKRLQAPKSTDESK